MNEFINVDTRWTQRLRCSERPSELELREHLLAVHRRHAGFTESCARRCRDGSGRNSYEWLAEAIDPNRHQRVLDLACGSGVLYVSQGGQAKPRKHQESRYRTELTGL